MAVGNCSVAIDTRVPSQMADEPARAVLEVSVVRFTQLKNNYGCKTKFSSVWRR